MTEVGCQATNKFRRHPCPQLLRAAKILLEARARASLVPPFMVPRRVQNRRCRLAMLLPFVPPPRSRSALQVSRTRTRTIGFMVPMPDSEIVQAFHEPSRVRVADPRSGPRLCEAQRFMVPMRAQKRKEATNEPQGRARLSERAAAGPIPAGAGSHNFERSFEAAARTSDSAESTSARRQSSG